MHKKEFQLTAQSTPYEISTTARPYQVAWSPGQQAIHRQDSRRVHMVHRAEASSSTKHLASSPTTKLQLLPRSKKASGIDLDALAPEGQLYVCPEPICCQHFRKDCTRATVLEHLLYDAHTIFSYRKNENVCPFWCQKGFHDLDLLKEHLRAQKCVFAKVFDDLPSDIEPESGHELLDTSEFAFHSCNMGFTTVRGLYLHMVSYGCYFSTIFASILLFLARGMTCADRHRSTFIRFPGKEPSPFTGIAQDQITTLTSSRIHILFKYNQSWY